MVHARKIKEIVVEVINNIGIINDMTKVIVELGLHIQAIAGAVEHGRAMIRIVTEDNLRVADALRHKGYAPLEMEALLIEVTDMTEAVLTITEKLYKAGIDIDHLYSADGVREERYGIIIACSNNNRALMELTH